MKKNETVKISRRGFLGGAVTAPLVVCSAIAHGQQKSEDAPNNAPGRRLIPWFRVNSVKLCLEDYHRTFDAWSEGGICGIAVGHMSFVTPKGEVLPAFQSDPKVFKTFGIDPPSELPPDPEMTKKLKAMLDDAAGRGWEVMIFDITLDDHKKRGGSRPVKEDPYGAVNFSASVQDLMNAFPQAQGVIIDGPGEHGYEPKNFFGGRGVNKQRLEQFGIDIARYERGMKHLEDRFHNLTPALVRYHSTAGVLDGLSLFDIDEDALYWLRTNQEDSLRHMVALRGQIDKLNRKVKFGGIPRSPVFSMMTTQDYQRMNPYFDYFFAKHYFWHRGYDGMYGTIARWVQNIHEWNPSLTETDCFTVVKSWLGIELPCVNSLNDMDRGFPDEFFDKVVFQETRRALEAVGDDNKLIAWVSTGRRPHDGDPMSAHDLYRILVASQKAGLKRFIYQTESDPGLGVPEWSVISELCGKPWKETPGGYWPPGTTKR